MKEDFMFRRGIKHTKEHCEKLVKAWANSKEERVQNLVDAWGDPLKKQRRIEKNRATRKLNNDRKKSNLATSEKNSISDSSSCSD